MTVSVLETLARVVCRVTDRSGVLAVGVLHTLLAGVVSQVTDGSGGRGLAVGVLHTLLAPVVSQVTDRGGGLTVAVSVTTCKVRIELDFDDEI